ncbi:MAG: folylpolyglutamate synthase/dihydrofolate synthase family protein [Acidobacteriota bacterium]
MNYSESLGYLYGLGHEILAAKFRLENIRAVLDRLGSPDQAYQSVLIAGTNGKGSTSAMVESIVRHAGYRTALYTSPHLVHIEERIKINGENIRRDDFARLATLVRETSEALVADGILETVPTFFEQITAIALTCFREQRINLAVLEVGLGGRLDATNAADRIVSVVTTIDFDHQKILGESIEEIAFEKACVIREGVIPVIGRQFYEAAYDVLSRRCMQMKTSPIYVNQPYQIRMNNFGSVVFDYDSSKNTYKRVMTGLRGRHQADNAVTAIEVAEALTDLGFTIPREAIIRGLREVRWPGRLEFINNAPAFLLDGAHNESGARTLRNYLREVWHGHLTLIFGVMNDKDYVHMAEELFSLPEVVILTRVDDRRAASSEKMGNIAYLAPGRVIFTPDVELAIREALDHTPEDGLICVAGSLYLVGEAKKIIQERQVN